MPQLRYLLPIAAFAAFSVNASAAQPPAGFTALFNEKDLSGWRGGELAGFDNIASVLGVDQAQYERYFQAAQPLAAEAMAFDASNARGLTCELADPACLKSSIEAAGLKGHRVGAAEVSPMHANYFVNTGGGTAADVRGLIAHAQRVVEDRFGVRLEPEVKMIGARGEYLNDGEGAKV